jgi:hypothetical protein
MFTVLLSRPQVAGVAWYDLVDRWAFLPGGGLLDESWRPKLVYRRLEELLANAGKIPRLYPSGWTLRRQGDRLPSDSSGECRVVVTRDVAIVVCVTMAPDLQVP